MSTSMQLTDYFDSDNEHDVRIRGTRIGIETVLFDFLEGISPEEIAVRYRSLTLEQVYATITYYLQQHEAVSEYLDGCRRAEDIAVAQQDRKPSNVVRRMRALKQPVS